MAEIRGIEPHKAREFMQNAWDEVSKAFKVSKGIQSYHKRGGKRADEIAMAQLAKDFESGGYLPKGFLDRCERKRVRIKKRGEDDVFNRSKPILTMGEIDTLYNSLKTCQEEGHKVLAGLDTDAVHNGLAKIFTYTMTEEEHNNALEKLKGREAAEAAP